MTSDWVSAALVLLGLVLLITIGTLVACLVHEHREAQVRRARLDIVTGAEEELRASTRATMQAMRDTIRQYGGPR